MAKAAKPTTAQEYIAQVAEPHRTAVKSLHAMITKALPKPKPSIQEKIIKAAAIWVSAFLRPTS